MRAYKRTKKRQSSGVGEFHQNSSYHRYFEGWAEYETLNEKGKVKIDRVYVGEYHCIDLPRRTWNLLRIALWAAAILSLLIFIFGATRNTVQNSAAVPALMQFITVGGYMAMFFALANLRSKMTLYEHRAGPLALKKRAVVTASASALCAVISVAFSLVCDLSLSERAELASILSFVLAAGVSAATAYVVCHLPIKVIENDTKVPEGSVIIRRPGE